MTNERAIDALLTVRAYYASLTADYPKGKDRKGIGDVMCSEIANACHMASKALESQQRLKEMLNKQLKAYAEQSKNRNFSDLEYGRMTAYDHCLEVLENDE